jgi:geranylgeranyl diphosphate synthase type II
VIAQDVRQVLDRYAPAIAQALEDAVPPVPGALGPIHEAMRYSLSAGGKRLRPALCFASAEAVGGTVEDARAPAAALELIHTYSLIHDDLPCMDDDDLRRGRPTSHKVYGEAMAVLAGDGLLTRAFGLLAEGEGAPPDRQAEMVRILARAAGSQGMVGGQALDLAAEGSEDVDLPTLQYIHTHKTGALFRAACSLGGVAGGGDPEGVAALGRFGEKIGLAFQIVDDILDETGKVEDLGKNAGRDRALGKATYPRLLGLAESRRRVDELGAEARAQAGAFGEAGRHLAVLAGYVTQRTA